MAETRNKLELRFHGMRRAGNHAVVYWLAHHFDEPVWFANDIWSFDEPQIWTKRQRVMEALGMYEPECVLSPSEVSNFWEMPKNVVFHSYEDKCLASLNFAANRAVVGDSEKTWDVLVVRDPFNLFASRLAIQNPFVYPVNAESVEMWKEHAREALGYTDLLPNRICVSFNQWATWVGHRTDIEKCLGLSRCDKGLNDVKGLGSSFDGKARDASEMDVFGRWRRFAGSPGFRSLFADEELWELSGQLFGHIDGTEELRP